MLHIRENVALMMNSAGLASNHSMCNETCKTTPKRRFKCETCAGLKTATILNNHMFQMFDVESAKHIGEND